MRIINEVKRIVEEVLLQPFLYATDLTINDLIVSIADQLPCVAMVRLENGEFAHSNGMKDAAECLLFFVDITDASETDFVKAETVSKQKDFAKEFLKEVEKSSVIFSVNTEKYNPFYDKYDSLSTAGVYLTLTLKELAGDNACTVVIPPIEEEIQN